MGRRTLPPATEPPSALGLAEPLLTTAPLAGTIDFAALFARSDAARHEIEIGFGKGRFLLAEAQARPDTLFIGIEWAAPLARLVRERVLAARLPNVRLLHAEAADVLRRLVTPGSIDAIHVLFPDPWPKRRHQHRRLLRPDNLRLMARALRPGGELNLATDHAAYAEAIPPAVSQVPELEPASEFLLTGDIATRTHYAVKMSARGNMIFARSWRRRP